MTIDTALYNLPRSITIVDFHDFVYDKAKFVKRVLLRIHSDSSNAKYTLARHILTSTPASTDLVLSAEDSLWVYTTTRKILSHISKIGEDFQLKECKLYHNTAWVFQHNKLKIRFKVDRLYQTSEALVLVQYVLGAKDTGGWIKWMCERGARPVEFDCFDIPPKIVVVSCSASGAKSVRSKDFSDKLEQYAALITDTGDD